MSYKRAASTAGLLKRRSEWVASLKTNLPQFTESAVSPLKEGRRAAVLSRSERYTLDEAVKSSFLFLPTDWKDQATQRLAQTLHGVVEPQTLRQSDYFLCSLIHPTYVQASTVRCDEERQRRRLQQQLRRTVCMPLELTMAGSKSLRLIHEINSFVEAGARSSSISHRDGGGDKGLRSASSSSSSSSSFQLDAPWPELLMADTHALLASFQGSQLESLVLFDNTAFPLMPSLSDGGERRESSVPKEVSLAAFTALCGSIELVCGWASLVQYLGRIAREYGRTA